jgi:hypothetical protein
MHVLAYTSSSYYFCNRDRPAVNVWQLGVRLSLSSEHVVYCSVLLLASFACCYMYIDPFLRLIRKKHGCLESGWFVMWAPRPAAQGRGVNDHVCISFSTWVTQAMFGWYRLVLVVVVVFNTSKLTHKKLTPWMFGWR